MLSVKDYLLMGFAIAVYLLIGIRFPKFGRFMSRLFILGFCAIIVVALFSDANYTLDIVYSVIGLVLLILYSIYINKKIEQGARKNTQKARQKRQRVYKAYWTQKTHLGRADEYECSYCGARYLDPWDTCPSCQRKMTEVKYDPTWVDEIEEWDAMM